MLFVKNCVKYPIMILKLIRNGLGQLIVFLSFIYPPRRKTRSGSEQKKVDHETQKLALYQFHRCPFCVRVRRMIDRLNLSIEYRDAKNNAQHRNDLSVGGGKIKVPCLRIEEEDRVTWLYESLAINNYLQKRF